MKKPIQIGREHPCEMWTSVVNIGFFFVFVFFSREIDRQQFFLEPDILTWKYYFVNEIKFQENLVIVDVP